MSVSSHRPLPALRFSSEANEIYAAVRRFVGSRIANAATADDLTQEVLLKAHRRLPQIRDPRRLMGWVIQIARNTLIDHFRRVKQLEPIDDQRLAEEVDQYDATEVEEAQLREALFRCVRSIVQNLPQKYREALTLTLYDGLTQAELAKMLGLSVSAAKSRVQRARAMTRDAVIRCCAVETDAYGTVVAYTPRQTA